MARVPSRVVGAAAHWKVLACCQRSSCSSHCATPTRQQRPEYAGRPSLGRATSRPDHALLRLTATRSLLGGRPVGSLLLRPTWLAACAESPPPCFFGLAGGRRWGRPVAALPQATSGQGHGLGYCLSQGAVREDARKSLARAQPRPQYRWRMANTASAKSTCFQGRCLEDVGEPLCFTADFRNTWT